MRNPTPDGGGRRSERRLDCICGPISEHPDVDCPRHGICAGYGHLTDEDGDCHCGTVTG